MKNKHKLKKAKGPKASIFLHLSIFNSIFSRIIGCKIAKQIWNKLKEEFEGNSSVKVFKLLTLKRQFEILRMKEDKFVKGYATKVMIIVNQIQFT